MLPIGPYMSVPKRDYYYSVMICSIYVKYTDRANNYFARSMDSCAK